MASVVTAPPCQVICQVSDPGIGVDGDGDLADHGADQLLALDGGGRGRLEHGPDVGAGAGDPGQFLAGEGDGPAGLLRAQVVPGLPDGGELVFPGAFEGPGDQPVFRLDGVVLAAGAVSLIAGALDGQPEDRQVALVAVFGLGQRFGGGFQGGGLQDREQLGEDGLLQPQPADGLAGPLAAVELLGAGAHVAGAVAVLAGVTGLHDPAAPAAAQQALQQRPALAGRAAALAAGRPPVRPQPRGVGLVFLPGHVAGMMTGDQHRPLLAGQHLTLAITLPAAFTRFSVRVRPNTNAPA